MDITRELFLATSRRCWYCGFYGSVARGHNEQKRTIDHIIPLVRGGLDIPENFFPACFRCNTLKHVKTMLEFRQFIARKYPVEIAARGGRVVFWGEERNLFPPLIQISGWPYYRADPTRERERVLQFIMEGACR